MTEHKNAERHKNKTYNMDIYDYKHYKTHFQEIKEHFYVIFKVC